MSNQSVIIVAAGKGLRMGAELPKQFLSLSSRPILMRTIDKFVTALPQAEIIIALHNDYREYWQQLCSEYHFTTQHRIVEGGDTRFKSVKNCLRTLSSETEIVLVHDGVRPFVSGKLIKRIVSEAEEYGAVVPAVDVTDTLRRKTSDQSSIHLDREGIKSVQTPQCFKREIIVESYNRDDCTVFTDDASVVEASGSAIILVEGERTNIKITTEEDLLFGNYLLNFLHK